MIDDYTSIASDINDFCISFNSAIPQIATLTTATGPVTNGAPLVALLTSAAAQLQAKATIMMAQKDFLGFEIDTDFDNIQSTVIFGE